MTNSVAPARMTDPPCSAGCGEAGAGVGDGGVIVVAGAGTGVGAIACLGSTAVDAVRLP